MIGAIERLKGTIGELRKIAGVRASALVSREGLLIASDISGDVHRDTFAAMAATMLGAAETAAFELKQGPPDRVIVETDESRLFLIGAGERMMLAVLADARSDIKELEASMLTAVESIKRIAEERY